MNSRLMDLGLSFYDQYNLSTLPQVKEAAFLMKQVEQPSFIQMTSINGEATAFLGNDPLDLSKLQGVFYRKHFMVLPKYAQMINPDIMERELSFPFSFNAIDPKPEMFLNEEGLEDSVLLNVCGMTFNCTFKNMHFHHCLNAKNESHMHGIPLSKSHDTAGAPTCHLPVLSSYYNTADDLSHKLIVFYISAANLKNTDNFKVDPVSGLPMNELLQKFFADPNFEFQMDNPKTDLVYDENFKGIFLIPMLASDQRIFYHCILDVHGRANRYLSTRQNLAEWFYTVKKYNENPEDQIIFIEGNDTTYMYIEKWSISLGRDSIMGVQEKNEFYKPSILESKTCC